MPRRVYTYPAAMGWGRTEPARERRRRAHLRGAARSISINVVVSLRARRRRRRQSVGRRRRSSGRRRRRRRRTTSRRSRPSPSREPLWHADSRRRRRRAGDRTSARCSSPTCSTPSPIIATRCPGPSLWPFLTAIATSVHVRLVDLQPIGRRVGHRSRSSSALIGWFWPTKGKERPRSTASQRPPHAAGEPVVSTAPARRARRRDAADLRVRPPQRAVVGDDGHDRDRGDGVRALRSPATSI